MTFILEGLIHSDVEWSRNYVIRIKNGEGHLALYRNLNFSFESPDDDKTKVKLILFIEY